MMFLNNHFEWNKKYKLTESLRIFFLIEDPQETESTSDQY